MIADLAGALRAEARAADERRALVITGDSDACYDAAETALAAADVPRTETTLVGEASALACERIAPVHAGRLLGTTRAVVVVDAHDTCPPNVLGRTVGAVDGGGLFVLLTPPLEEWPARRDGFDESLAVPPFDVGDVTGRFRERLVETLRAHRGVAIYDADSEAVRDDGLTDPPPRRPRTPPTPPAGSPFPAAAFEACLTDDQAEAVAAFEALRDPDSAVVVESDRGRGKSAAAGLAAACLAAEGRDVAVTAPGYRSAREVFVRAEALLSDLGSLDAVSGDPPKRLDAGGGAVRFLPVAEAVDADPDVLLVDEAAALPVRRLESFLDVDAVGFTTTVHGYEGAGRGFDVRFRGRLADSEHEVTTVRLHEPIRYAGGDPVESWAFHALLLDARPPVDQLVEGATPETVAERAPTGAELADDEHLLREVFGLLVAAHYRTEPDDLARLLDAPNLSVRALCHDGHVVSVALLAREGALSADWRTEMYEGGRVPGNMIPDVLTSQLRDEVAGEAAGVRVVRIATHHAVRSRGLGSALLDAVEAGADADWVGSGFGATPELLDFWDANGYGAVHLSTTRNETSGEYSAIVLKPTSERGQTLHDDHAAWFADRAPAVLADALRDADPDVVRATLRATDADPDPDLDDRDWRLVAGAAYGPALYDVDPRPFRRLAVAHLVDPAPDVLSAREERLLVTRVLQNRSWGTVAEDLGYHSTSECMRALGGAYRPLVDAYGNAAARAERERYD
ncbi:MAG: tRNA(Met) cytidine acetyltransferase TmcA [Halobacteriaceae archaeon]